MGIVSSTSAALGLEGSGIVTHVGPRTSGLSVGDRVFVLGAGCFSTSVIASEKMCEKIPESLSFEDAATMPCVFGTVIYSLLHIGRLEPGQVCF
jgi:NADPH:quinone reductase-like Zn-dependent oxidoreductase